MSWYPSALASLWIGFSLMGLSGCASLHPLPNFSQAIHPTHTCAHGPESISPCAKQHVYTFIVNGLDPCNYSNLTGVRDHCVSLGYENTFYGQLYHGLWIEKRIRQIRAQDPQARFVLVGFSAGVLTVRNVACTLKNEGVCIDRMIYLGGFTLDNVPRNRPDNVGKLYHILANGQVWNGVPIDGAENIKCQDVWHFGSPTHPKSLQVLETCLTEAALQAGAGAMCEPSSRAEGVSISAPSLVQAGIPTQEAVTISTQSPVLVLEDARNDAPEWTFLKPVQRLQPVSLSGSIQYGRTIQGIKSARK
jgi:hypothetical protein